MMLGNVGDHAVRTQHADMDGEPRTLREAAQHGLCGSDQQIFAARAACQRMDPHADAITARAGANDRADLFERRQQAVRGGHAQT